MSVTLPTRAGLGLKPEHYRAAHAAAADGLWFEVHPENYMTPGGPRLAWLERIRDMAAISLHGVGLSLGGAEPVDPGHLGRLKALTERFAPASVSEHIAWSARDGAYFADLLPSPATRTALDRLCANIDRVQTALGREILVENPAHYLPLAGDLEEPEFLVEACRRTGCGLLLDINNVYVSAHNLGRDARAYLSAIPGALAGEVHLAGHAPDKGLGGALLIDSHGAPVAEPVWALYDYALTLWGPKPTLIERDENLPAFETLRAERDRADARLAALMHEGEGAHV